MNAALIVFLIMSRKTTKLINVNNTESKRESEIPRPLIWLMFAVNKARQGKIPIKKVCKGTGVKNDPIRFIAVIIPSAPSVK